MLTLYSDVHYISQANVVCFSYSDPLDNDVFLETPRYFADALRRLITIPKPQPWNIKFLEGVIFDETNVFAGNLYESLFVTLPASSIPKPIIIHRDDLCVIAPLLQSLQSLAIAYYDNCLWMKGIQEDAGAWVVQFDDTKGASLLDRSRLYRVAGSLAVRDFPLTAMVRAAKRLESDAGIFRVECDGKHAIVSDLQRLREERLKLRTSLSEPITFYARHRLEWPTVHAQRADLRIEQRDGFVSALTWVWNVEGMTLHYAIAPAKVS